MLINIDELIRNLLNQTNGTVSWETIVMMIAGGVERVQPVSAKSIAKYMTSTFGANYTSTKLQPTILNATNSNVTKGRIVVKKEKSTRSFDGE